MELMKLYKKHWVEFSINAKKHMNEGTCGYGVDGENLVKNQHHIC